MVARENVTLESFKQFADEHSDHLFELINGEIVEKMPGTTSNSGISAVLIMEVGSFCKQNHLPYFVSGEAGSYDVLGHAFAPDFAYKQTPLSKDYPDPIPPLWVVEVVSANDKPRLIRVKRQVYLQSGILYWEIYPEEQSVDVYVPGQPVQTFGIDDTLDVGDLISGFTLPVRELFTSD